jgi:hypothetical protein
MMKIDQPEGEHGLASAPTNTKDFFRQHGEELLLEGRRSIRRVGVAALVVGITFSVVLLALVAAGVYALLHTT